MIGSNVSLRLTRNPAILKELRTRNAFGADGNYHMQFNAQDFVFGKDNTVTVPRNVAECLMNTRSLFGGSPRKREVDGETVSYLSAYDADLLPVLEIVEEWAPGEQAPSVKAALATTCNICSKDQGSVEKLIKHLGTHVAEPAGAAK